MHTDTNPSELLTIAAAAKLCGVTSQAVRTWIRDNKIPFVTLPSGLRRIRRSDIDLTPRYAHEHNAEATA